jgi:Fe2+ transport system protein FeoA
MTELHKKKKFHAISTSAAPATGVSLYEVNETLPHRIIRIMGSRSIRLQLTQMGIQPGDTICIKRRVPFGGALMIENRGSLIALSRGFAEQILVES